MTRLVRLLAIAGIGVLVTLLALRYDIPDLLFASVAGSPEVTSAPQAPRSAPARTSSTQPLQAKGAEDKLKLFEEDAKLPAKDRTEGSQTKFDVVRIDPDGASVFAGRAPANSTVTVLANERPVASAKANENGEWAVAVDQPLAGGDYQLSLTAKAKQTAAVEAGQTLRITVPPSQRPKLENVSASPPTAGPALPKPITFTYDQATFTPDGSKSAAFLNDYLAARKPASITLSGHADERGTDSYNMELSQQRLDAVVRYLRSKGFTGKLILRPMGKTEPYNGIDRNSLTEEQAYQLDRRVELRLLQ